MHRSHIPVFGTAMMKLRRHPLQQRFLCLMAPVDRAECEYQKLRILELLPSLCATRNVNLDGHLALYRPRLRTSGLDLVSAPEQYIRCLYY